MPGRGKGPRELPELPQADVVWGWVVDDGINGLYGVRDPQWLWRAVWCVLVREEDHALRRRESDAGVVPPLAKERERIALALRWECERECRRYDADVVARREGLRELVSGLSQTWPGVRDRLSDSGRCVGCTASEVAWCGWACVYCVNSLDVATLIAAREADSEPSGWEWMG